MVSYELLLEGNLTLFIFFPPKFSFVCILSWLKLWHTRREINVMGLRSNTNRYVSHKV